MRELKLLVAVAAALLLAWLALRPAGDLAPTSGAGPRPDRTAAGSGAPPPPAPSEFGGRARTPDREVGESSAGAQDDAWAGISPSFRDEVGRVWLSLELHPASALDEGVFPGRRARVLAAGETAIASVVVRSYVRRADRSRPLALLPRVVVVGPPGAPESGIDLRLDAAAHERFEGDLESWGFDISAVRAIRAVLPDDIRQPIPVDILATLDGQEARLAVEIVPALVVDGVRRDGDDGIEVDASIVDAALPLQVDVVLPGGSRVHTVLTSLAVPRGAQFAQRGTATRVRSFTFRVAAAELPEGARIELWATDAGGRTSRADGVLK